MPRPYVFAGHPAKSQPVYLPKPIQNGLGRALNNVEHVVEAIVAAVVRIGHLVIAGLGVELAEEARARAVVTVGIEVERVVQVATIHREDVVEVVEIVTVHLPRSYIIQINTPLRRRRAHPGVRLLPDVPLAGSRRVDLETVLEPGLHHDLPEEALGEWASADVAEANEQNADRTVGHSQVFVM